MSLRCVQSSLRQADHSSRGVLRNVVRRAVCDLENLVNEEALAHWGLSRQYIYIYIYWRDIY